MSPSAELTAKAAAAVVRRNVISGAAIFTVGDAAAQMLTNSRSKQNENAILATKTASAPTDSNGVVIREGEGATPQSYSPNTTNGFASAVSSLDMNRLCSSTVLGAVWSGFCVPFIYGTVEKTFPGKANLRQILIKVLVTCSILSTIGNYITMFARRFAAQYTTHQFDKSSSLRLRWFSRPFESMALFLAIVKGCVKSCNRDIGEVIVDDLKIWPLYDLTCYSLIPPAWRPITTSFMSSGWAMYMSIVSAKDEGEEEEDSFDAQALSSSIEPPAAHEQREPQPPTIHVTPLDPFPKHPTTIISAVPGETMKRLIGVTGGNVSNATNYNYNY